MAEAKKRLLKRYSKEEIDAIIELYASTYGDSGLTAQEVLEEIICDAKGNMNAFATEKTKRVAVVDNDILSNINTEKWSKETIEQAKTAARYTLSKFSEGIFVNGITRKVNHDSKKSLHVQNIHNIWQIRI